MCRCKSSSNSFSKANATLKVLHPSAGVCMVAQPGYFSNGRLRQHARPSFSAPGFARCQNEVPPAPFYCPGLFHFADVGKRINSSFFMWAASSPADTLNSSCISKSSGWLLPYTSQSFFQVLLQHRQLCFHIAVVRFSI